MEQLAIWVAVGFLIGSIGTIIGAGGGFLLVPLLLFARPEFTPEQITAISMAIVAANAVSGSIVYAKSKRIDFRAGLIFAAFTIPGSVIGAYLTKYVPQHVFSIGFGILLTLLAIYLFVKNAKKAPATTRPIHKRAPGWRTHSLTDATGEHFTYSYNQTYGIVISILVGFISPILGIGGGIIHVPAMVQLLRFPLYIATATSHFVLAIMATITVIVHVMNGVYNDRDVITLVLALAAGVIPGAVTGAKISHHIPTSIVIRVMAVCLGLVGMRILLKG
jgi:uncharacterized membrane protein YfcA